jgi:hypothetical protein
MNSRSSKLPSKMSHVRDGRVYIGIKRKDAEAKQIPRRLNLGVLIPFLITNWVDMGGIVDG